MSFRVTPFAAAAALLSLAWAGVARATYSFPGVIQQVTGAAVAPPCTICHNNPLGGLMTVTTTFGIYMRSRGLMPYDETSLRKALMAAQGEGHISNSEGIKDIDALKQGQDPNAPMGGLSTQQPAFGCGAHVAPRGDADMAAVSLFAAAAAIGVFRRQRSKPCEPGEA